MTRYVSILRGINVGGKRKMLMADLKELYQELGFSNIITYIQSGNVVFNSNQFLESKLKTPATTRNWKTVQKLLALADAS